jgi:hypothetical protein
MVVDAGKRQACLSFQRVWVGVRVLYLYIGVVYVESIGRGRRTTAKQG